MSLVWSNRMFCSSILIKSPRGLPTVIQSAPSLTVLGDLWSLVDQWHTTDSTHGLELLDSQ